MRSEPDEATSEDAALIEAALSHREMPKTTD